MGIVSKKRREDMIENNLLMVLDNIGASIISVLSTLWGHFVVLLMFILGYFSSISSMIHVILLLVIVDAIFGIAVSIHNKGVGSIMSNKLRNTLFKLFFYLLFVMFTFLIEFQVTGIDCITPKIVFAIVSATELWSIASNALILSPKMPFLRIFKKYLTKEIGKKLDMTPDEVEEFLNEKKEDADEEK